MKLNYFYKSMHGLFVYRNRNFITTTRRNESNNIQFNQIVDGLCNCQQEYECNVSLLDSLDESFMELYWMVMKATQLLHANSTHIQIKIQTAKSEYNKLHSATKQQQKQ